MLRYVARALDFQETDAFERGRVVSLLFIGLNAKRWIFIFSLGSHEKWVAGEKQTYTTKLENCGHASLSYAVVDRWMINFQS